jgi:TatD DNase family protein
MLENFDAAGVEKIIVPGTEPEDFPVIIELVNKYDNVYGLLGVHPTEAQKWHDGLIDEITELSQNPKIVGIGETGLDYYHDRSFIDVQKDVFIKHIRLANRLGLPLNVHDREAHEDTFEILQKYNNTSTTSKVVMHCFSGDLEFARKCIDAGYYLGIGGVVTFKNAHALKEVVKEVALERILLETDAPYLAPVPFRGKENRPAYVRYAAQEIAQLRGITFEEVDEVTTQNAKEVFGLPPLPQGERG